MKIRNFTLEQLARRQVGSLALRRQGLERVEHVSLLAVLELVEQGLDPGFGFGLFGEEFVRDGPQMGGGMVKVQAFEAGDEAVFNDVPNPHRPVRQDKDVLGFAHAAADRLGMDGAAKFCRRGLGRR